MLESRLGHPPESNGYTLVELMVVIVLIGILSAAILPQFGGTYDEARLRAASREIVALCHLGHSQAVTTGREHRVRVDAARGRLRLEEKVEAPPEAAAEIAVAWRPSDAAQRFDVPPSITLAAHALRGGWRGGWDDDSGDRWGDRGDRGDRGTDRLGDDGSRWGERDDARDGRSGGGAIHFLPDGTVEAPRVALRDRSGCELWIDVHPSTARVRVTSEYHGPGSRDHGGWR